MVEKKNTSKRLLCSRSPTVILLHNASCVKKKKREKKKKKPSGELCFPLHEGRATYSDKLFKFRNGRFEDLLSDDINEHRDVANRMAGRSVACVDRKVPHTHRHTCTHAKSVLRTGYQASNMAAL